MCTLNGEKYIAEQLESIKSQTYKSWRIIVSDDGSTDSTVEIINTYIKKWGKDRINYREGPKKNFCINFLTLISDPFIEGEYFVLCDQDDYWLPKKLEVAISTYKAKLQNPNIPYLYGARTTYTNETLRILRDSPLYIFPCSFRNALIQNILGGNTIFFNRATKLLVEKIGVVNVPTHDWWMYLIVSGAGGVVFYDKTSNILYRQHSKAAVGGGDRIIDRINRLIMVINNKFKKWSDIHIYYLKQNSNLLTIESNQILDNFIKLREERIGRRFRMLEICGLYRQTFKGTLSLYLSILLKKI
jgi:glycosyltransferase involved in cell wall biosynthesis